MCVEEARRRRNTTTRGDSDRRSSFQRDRARLVYSQYLRRLGGVTQIVSPTPQAPLLHNRQMHSIKVALVAKEIAEDIIRQARGDCPEWLTKISDLGGLDSIVCEVAGLAHDLGHPPFGHIAEPIMDAYIRAEAAFSGLQKSAPDPSLVHTEDLSLCSSGGELIEGFEGNAQSFRIVTRLDSHKQRKGERIQGLDLTNASLAAILKYPWWKSKEEGPFNAKYGVYPDDLEEFRNARSWVPETIGPTRQTLEAAIMDTADDITYAIHDLQDFYLKGLIDSRDAVKILRDQRTLMGQEQYKDFADMDEEEIRKVQHREREQGQTVGPFEESYRKLAIYYKGFANRSDYMAALNDAMTLFQDKISVRHNGSPTNQANAQTAFSEQIADYISSVELREPCWERGPHIFPASPQWHSIQVMKTIARQLIISTPYVSVFQQSQRKALTDLLLAIDEWITESGEMKTAELPEPLRTYYCEATGREHAQVVKHTGVATRRAIVDCLCSMSDYEVLRWADWFSGRALPAFGDL